MTPDQQKEFFKTRFSLKGTIHYTRALFTPTASKSDIQKHGANATKKYSVVLAWDPRDPANFNTLKAMYDFMAKAKQTFNPNVPEQFYHNPVKQFDTYRRRDGKQAQEFLAGKHWINLSSGEKFKPKVVDVNKADIIDEAPVYSGVQAAVSFSFYLMGAKNAESQKGLGVNIVAVMVLGGGTPDPIGEFNVDLDEAFGHFNDMSQPMGQGYGQQTQNQAYGNGMGQQQQQYSAPPSQPAQQTYGNGMGTQQQYTQGQQYPAQQSQPAQGQPAYNPPAAPPQQQPQYAPPAPQGQPGQQPQYHPGYGPSAPQQGQGQPQYQQPQQGQPVPQWAGPQY